MATLKELRAAKAKAQEDLRAADGKLARVEADLTVARNHLQELHGQLASGARVAAQLASLASRVEVLESEQERAEKDAEAARDAFDDASTVEQEFILETAESATKALTPNDALGELQAILDSAQTDAVRNWARTALGIARCIVALRDAPPAASFAGRSTLEHLGDALKAHFALYMSLVAAPTAANLGGELLVPADADVEERGISHGGRDRLHWETPAVFRGRRGTAYVELYLTRR